MGQRANMYRWVLAAPAWPRGGEGYVCYFSRTQWELGPIYTPENQYRTIHIGKGKGRERKNKRLEHKSDPGMMRCDSPSYGPSRY